MNKSIAAFCWVGLVRLCAGAKSEKYVSVELRKTMKANLLTNELYVFEAKLCENGTNRKSVQQNLIVGLEGINGRSRVTISRLQQWPQI